MGRASTRSRCRTSSPSPTPRARAPSSSPSRWWGASSWPSSGCTPSPWSAGGPGKRPGHPQNRNLLRPGREVPETLRDRPCVGEEQGVSGSPDLHRGEGHPEAVTGEPVGMVPVVLGGMVHQEDGMGEADLLGPCRGKIEGSLYLLLEIPRAEEEDDQAHPRVDRVVHVYPGVPVEELDPRLLEGDVPHPVPLCSEGRVCDPHEKEHQEYRKRRAHGPLRIAPGIINRLRSFFRLRGRILDFLFKGVRFRPFPLSGNPGKGGAFPLRIGKRRRMAGLPEQG